MRVGILGMAGRMGRLLIEESRARGHQVVGGTLNPLSQHPVVLDVPAMALSAFVDMSDVVIDFTHASTLQAHAKAMAISNAAWIVGTTGLSAEDEQAMVAAARTIPVVAAAHFGLGINLLRRVARDLAAVLSADEYDAEIVEMHHRQKVDAPSGSAIVLGRAVAEGRNVQLEDVMESGRDGHTGPRRRGAIGFAALRGGQVVGDHTLIFASDHEQITLVHRVLDRRVFAAWAVRASTWVMGKQPGLYSIDDVLEFR